MKTPTLIVRLLGIYLIYSEIFTLWQLGHVAKVPPGTEDPALFFRIYVLAGLFVGVISVVFAGRLARLLTFDAECIQGSANQSIDDLK